MSRINLAKYRMEKAREIIKEAEDALEHDHPGNSVNRSYYAMFTAARAILALKELDSSKHSGIIALFSQHIIKPGLFPEELSKFLRESKRIRESADYGDFIEITKEDAQTHLQRAGKFVEEAEKTMQEIIESAEKR